MPPQGIEAALVIKGEPTVRRNVLPIPGTKHVGRQLPG
jgi:hypothetical protein